MNVVKVTGGTKERMMVQETKEKGAETYATKEIGMTAM